ncbi:hypothetical protein D3C72_2285020 [compost metagenome]
MQYRIDRMLAQHRGDPRTVAHVGLYEQRRDAGDVADPADHPGVAVAQRIDDDHRMALLLQFHTGVGADESSAAGNQNIHFL